jgi:hypothetical protein
MPEGYRTARRREATEHTRRRFRHTSASLLALIVALAVVTGGSGGVNPPAAVAAPTTLGIVRPGEGIPKATTTTVRVTRPGFPDATTTGVPMGVRLKPAGELVVTAAGTVIDGLDIQGCVVIQASNVTVRRSRIRCQGAYVVKVADTASGVLLEDVEIDGAGNPSTVAIGLVGYTVRRANIHHVGDGPRMASATVVEDSFIHDLSAGPGSHTDGIQSTGGTGITIRHNRIENPRRQTSCIMLGADLGDISSARVEGNLLNGGNFTVYAGAEAGRKATAITISGNHFGRDAVYGPGNVAATGVTWTGNVWHDTGHAIPKP